MNSGFCLESSFILSKMRSVCALKISPQVGDRQATFTECSAAFRTCRSSSPRHSSSASLGGRIAEGEQCFAAAKRTAETAEARTLQPSASLFESRAMSVRSTVSWSTISRCPSDSETTFRTLSSWESAYWARIGSTRGTCGLRCSAIVWPACDLCVTPKATTSRSEVSSRYCVFWPLAPAPACCTLSMSTLRSVPMAPTVA
mmetsp:Transcript_5242/g.15479  ORF Transcript_5242/g.15479 Transcript_5242/m.15479 type:complete len:201 (+) Transcript_5242:583-1185(+)